MSNKKEVVERQTIKIEDKDYYADSLPKEAITILGDLKVIGDEMKKLEVSFNIARIAKDAVYNKLKDGISEYEEVILEK